MQASVATAVKPKPAHSHFIYSRWVGLLTEARAGSETSWLGPRKIAGYQKLLWQREHRKFVRYAAQPEIVL